MAGESWADPEKAPLSGQNQFVRIAKFPKIVRILLFFRQKNAQIC